MTVRILALPVPAAVALPTRRSPEIVIESGQR
jgi:hypothetical protein